MKQLILGGARSGKSRLAEQLAEANEQPVIYIATATAGDSEMAQRIEHHRRQRPSHWETVESPLLLAETLEQYASSKRTILVDCLTLWLCNHLCDNSDLSAECKKLSKTIDCLPGNIILVSNEIGMGVVPIEKMTRQFVDESGRMHQVLAQSCERVILTVAGLPHILKGEPL